MKNQGGGKIINNASIDGFKPEPFVSIYSISKAGVRMITKAFAAERLKQGRFWALEGQFEYLWPDLGLDHLTLGEPFIRNTVGTLDKSARMLGICDMRGRTNGSGGRAGGFGPDKRGRRG